MTYRGNTLGHFQVKNSHFQNKAKCKISLLASKNEYYTQILCENEKTFSYQWLGATQKWPITGNPVVFIVAHKYICKGSDKHLKINMIL